MRILSIGVKKLDYDIITGNIKSIDLNKPWGNILYGSTLDKLPCGLITSSWNYFTACDYTEKWCKHGVSFTLYKKSKILEIDSLEDYIRYMDKYKIPNIDDSKGRGPYKYQLDFYKISKDFDAFHLTEKAFYELRLPFFNDIFDVLYNLHYDNFYSYDAETWIIFNSDCINKGSVLYHNNIVDSVYYNKQFDEINNLY